MHRGTKRGAWVFVISAERPSECHNAPRFYMGFESGSSPSNGLPSNEGYAYQRGLRRDEDDPWNAIEQLGPDWLGADPQVRSLEFDDKLSTYWEPGRCSMYQPHYRIPKDLIVQGRRLRILSLRRLWRDGVIEESVT